MGAYSLNCLSDLEQLRILDGEALPDQFFVVLGHLRFEALHRCSHAGSLVATIELMNKIRTLIRKQIMHGLVKNRDRIHLPGKSRTAGYLVDLRPSEGFVSGMSMADGVRVDSRPRPLLLEIRVRDVRNKVDYEIVARRSVTP